MGLLPPSVQFTAIDAAFNQALLNSGRLAIGLFGETSIAAILDAGPATYQNVLPSITGQGGNFLGTDGTSIFWASGGSVLPPQTGNAGKFLTTNGTSPSWAALPPVTYQFNVKAYGAKGDGSTNDSAAIDACYTAAYAFTTSGSQKGATVFWPEGTYVTHQPVWARSAIHTLGCGITATVISPSTFDGPGFISYAPGQVLNLTTNLLTGSGNAMVCSFADGQYGPCLSMGDCWASTNMNGQAYYCLEYAVKPTGNFYESFPVSCSGSDPTNPVFGVAYGIQFVDQSVFSGPAGVSYQIWGYLRVGSTNTLIKDTGPYTYGSGQHYVAHTYDGTTVRLFVDGVETASTAASGTITQYAWDMGGIGINYQTWPYLGGEFDVGTSTVIDSVRLSNTPRYTTNFSPPTTKNTVDGQTILLLNFDNIVGSFVVGQNNGGQQWFPVHASQGIVPEQSGGSRLENMGFVGGGGIFMIGQVNSSISDIFSLYTTWGLRVIDNSYKFYGDRLILTGVAHCGYTVEGACVLNSMHDSDFDGGYVAICLTNGSVTLDNIDISSHPGSQVGLLLNTPYSVTLNNVFCDLEELGNHSTLSQTVVVAGCYSLLVTGGEWVSYDQYAQPWTFLANNANTGAVTFVNSTFGNATHVNSMFKFQTPSGSNPSNLPIQLINCSTDNSAPWVDPADPKAPGVIVTNEPDHLNVMTFGAYGDGVHDDAPAFQAAINTLVFNGEVGSGTVFAPRHWGSETKTFRFNSPVILNNSGVQIEGDGKYGTVIENSGSYEGPLFICNRLPTSGAGNGAMQLTTALLTGGTGTALNMCPDYPAADQYRYVNLSDIPSTEINGLSQLSVNFTTKFTASGGDEEGLWGCFGSLPSGYAEAGSNGIVAWNNGDGTFSPIFTLKTTTGFYTIGAPATHAVAYNTQTHFALEYDGTTFTAYVAGTSIGSMAVTGTVVRKYFEPNLLGANYLQWPEGEDPINFPPGTMDSFRISNIQRYSSNFTPPTAKYTTDANTLILFNFNTTDVANNMLQGQTTGTPAYFPVQVIADDYASSQRWAFKNLSVFNTYGIPIYYFAAIGGSIQSSCITGYKGIVGRGGSYDIVLSDLYMTQNDLLSSGQAPAAIEWFGSGAIVQADSVWATGWKCCIASKGPLSGMFNRLFYQPNSNVEWFLIVGNEPNAVTQWNNFSVDGEGTWPLFKGAVNWYGGLSSTFSQSHFECLGTFSTTATGFAISFPGHFVLRDCDISFLANGATGATQIFTFYDGMDTDTNYLQSIVVDNVLQRYPAPGSGGLIPWTDSAHKSRITVIAPNQNGNLWEIDDAYTTSALFSISPTGLGDFHVGGLYVGTSALTFGSTVYLQNNASTLFTNGNFQTGGFVQTGGAAPFYGTNGYVATLSSVGVVDGASAVSVVIDSTGTFATPGAKLLSVRNNTVEKAFFDYTGSLTIANAGGVTSSLTLSSDGFGSTISEFYQNLYINGNGTSGGAIFVQLNSVYQFAVIPGFLDLTSNGNGSTTKIKMAFTDLSGTPGAGIANTPTGAFALVMGSSATFTITNSLCEANSRIFVSWAGQPDSSGCSVGASYTSGGFNVYITGTPAAASVLNFWVIN